MNMRPRQVVLVALSLFATASSQSVPTCEDQAENPFGTCDGCADQFFMNPTCSQAYLCPAESNDGQLCWCGENEILLPDFSLGSGQCMDNSNEQYFCPGEFKIHCADDPVPTPLTSDNCECEGQLWVDPECKSAFSCQDHVANGGYLLECTQDDVIIAVNLRTWNWGCQEDEGQCPGGGGFTLGCSSQPYQVPTTCSPTDENPFGICECDGQVFTSEDCTQAFQCIDDATYNEINDGCLYMCEEYEIMVPEFSTGLFKCMDNSDGSAVCVGQFNVQCEDDPVETPITDEVCECNGQLWVSPDCKEAFSCRDTLAEGGFSLICADGEIIEIDVQTWNWGCQVDNGNCPGGGGFSLGCENGNVRIPTDCVPTDQNPLGTCDCDGQVYMNDDCSQAFQCIDSDDYPEAEDGCLYECETSQLMVPDFNTGLFKCIDNDNDEGECPGSFKTYCEDVTLGPESCVCDGQLWVSGDCTEAFSCRSTLINGGFSISCPEGETIHYGASFIQTVGCDTGSAQCPGGGGYHLGCSLGDDTETSTSSSASSITSSGTTTSFSTLSTSVILSGSPQCELVAGNPFGTCDGCSDQLFMNSLCTQAYLCTSDGSDGLLCECEGKDILVPDFATGTAQCLDNTNEQYFCPGEFKIHCADDPVPTPLTADNCECDGQLWVDPQCKSAFNCRQKMASGGYLLECTDNEIIEVNLRTWNWGCQEDEGQCPGGGGFTLGCSSQPYEVPTTCYPTIENPFGICECDGQVFTSEDCTHAFQCIDDETYNQVNDGCLYMCEEYEIMVPEFSTGLFKCMDNSDGSAVCVGQFNIQCEDDPVETPITDEVCECNGQLWVSPDCKEAFSCRDRMVNGGFSLTCEEGEIIEIDVQTWNWGCQPDNGNCPGGGGFSLGCENGNVRIPTDCIPTDTNPLGTCEFADQVYMNDDCSQAFQCIDSEDYPEAEDGCLYKCETNQLMVPDFNTGLFKCIDNDNDEGECPGSFKTYCEDVTLGPESCVCDGQLWVSGDCTEAFSCRERFVNGGFLISCPEGETIHYGGGFIQTVRCETGSAQCPGGGGYHLGCSLTDVPPTTSTTTTVSTTAPIRPECDSRSGNPFGTCDGCDGQFFMNSACTQAYVCSTDDSDGLLCECEGKDILVPDFATGTARCLDNTNEEYFCPGEFKIHCGDDPVPTPLTADNCECEGQLWVDPECKSAFNCREMVSNGGYYIECDDDEVIDIDIRTWNWGCQPDEGQCPGGGGFTLGCSSQPYQIPTQCYPLTENPFGICECDGQVFTNDECTQAFQCIDDGTYTFVNDGCLYVCEEHEIMIPEFSTGLFKCMDNSNGSAVCVGQFNIQCEDDPVETPITDEVCECNGQLWVSPDCKEAFSCRDRMVNGGFSLTCEEGEIIEIDVQTWNWGCQPDNGNCPGGGGFSLGCENGNVRIPTDCIPTDQNPLGTCDCDGQVYMNDDCSQAFQCIDSDDYPEAEDGCLYECETNQLMVPDFNTGLFKCIDNDNDEGECPGSFKTYCEDVTLGPESCVCDGQLWVSGDCTEAFSCRSRFVNGGFMIPCPDGETIHFGAGFIRNWGCEVGSAQCPGAGGYHLGCGLDDQPNTSPVTTPPSPSTGPTASTTNSTTEGNGGGGGDDGSQSLSGISILIFLLCITTALLN